MRYKLYNVFEAILFLFLGDVKYHEDSVIFFFFWKKLRLWIIQVYIFGIRIYID